MQIIVDQKNAPLEFIAVLAEFIVDGMHHFKNFTE